MKSYFDKYGFLHIRPEEPNADVEQTENAPTFTGEYMTLLELRDKLTEDDCWDFLASIGWLYKGRWRTTPISQRDRFSHDNLTGVVAGLLVCKRFAKRWGMDMMLKEIERHLDKVPVFSLERPHIRDIIFYGYAKYPVLFFPFLWILAIIQIISCYRVKDHNGNISTSSKLLAFTRCHSAGLSLTWLLCDKLVKRQWIAWHFIFEYYFKDSEHPNVKLCREWEVENG
jgi:hypothetical protein